MKVKSKNAKSHDNSAILANYSQKYPRVHRSHASEDITVEQVDVNLQFKTDTRLPRLGLMLVGWGGNNGTTVTASIIANQKQLKWRTREGWQHANYYGSISMASTVNLGVDENGDDVFVPMNSLLPMVNPNDIILDGWDLNGDDLAVAMERSQVLEPHLQQLVEDDMRKLKPRPSIYYPQFIAENQKDRVNNIIKGSKWEQLGKIRSDIREFKEMNGLDKVIVLWTATTERWCLLEDEVHGSAKSVLRAIQSDHEEISPSIVFAVASILENCPFINGSPQNTLVPGIVQLAEQYNVPVAGDDFKSGQTKLKAVLTDFLVSAGIKPLSITSYNHLGNNDGKNLSAPLQFRSKEISKSNLVDDIVETNSILYPAKTDKPDHTVVIKYVPAVGDSKRAMDEYYSEIFMGGRSTIAIHNTCEDSLLAAPLILDLVIFTELFTRISYRVLNNDDVEESEVDANGNELKFSSFHPVLSILAYFLKAPQCPPGIQVQQSLFQQKNAIENLLLACLGISRGNSILSSLLCK